MNWLILSFPITRTSIVMLKKSHIFNLCITFLPFHVSKNPFRSIISTLWSSMCAIFNVKNRMIKKLLVFVWVPFFYPPCMFNLFQKLSCIPCPWGIGEHDHLRHVTKIVIKKYLNFLLQGGFLLRKDVLPIWTSQGHFWTNGENRIFLSVTVFAQFKFKVGHL